jgi:hypothetical protein
VFRHKRLTGKCQWRACSAIPVSASLAGWQSRRHCTRGEADGTGALHPYRSGPQGACRLPALRHAVMPEVRRAPEMQCRPMCGQSHGDSAVARHLEECTHTARNSVGEQPGRSRHCAVWRVNLGAATRRSPGAHSTIAAALPPTCWPCSWSAGFMHGSIQDVSLRPPPLHHSPRVAPAARSRMPV